MRRYALPLISTALLASCVPPITQEQIRPNAAERPEEQVFTRVQVTLQGLRYEVTGSSVDCAGDPACLHPTVSVEGRGFASKEEILQAFEQTGIHSDLSSITIIKVPNIPLVQPLPWPISGRVELPSHIHTGSQMDVRIRFWNLTLQKLSLAWESPDLEWVIFDDTGQPVRWSGEWLYLGALNFIRVPALEDITLFEPVRLNYFNPSFPFLPGHYILRLHIKKLSLSLDPLLWLPGSNKTLGDVTLPDVPFEIVP